MSERKGKDTQNKKGTQECKGIKYHIPFESGPIGSKSRLTHLLTSLSRAFFGYLGE